MQIVYGNYRHPIGECAVSISRVMRESDNGRPYEYDETWTLDGEMLGSSPAEVAGRVARLNDAYGKQRRVPMRMYSVGGIVLHELPDSGSTTGVRVLAPPHYPDGVGSEGVTGRKFSVTVGATYPLPGTERFVKSWNETLRFSGGGIRRDLVETVNTLPIAFITHLATIYRATQSGQAVGYLRYPDAPPPIWPNAVVGEQVRVLSGARETAGQLTDFPISWSYSFASPTPLVGFPNKLYR